MTAFLLLTLSTVNASATEVGETRPLGAGVAVGFNQGVTAKYWLSDKLAVSALVTPPLGVLYANVQAEYQFVQFFDLNWARLDMYGWGGPAFLMSLDGSSTMLGGAGGVGVSLRFHDVPLEAYSQVGVSAGLFLGTTPGALPSAVSGARWYF